MGRVKNYLLWVVLCMGILLIPNMGGEIPALAQGTDLESGGLHI